MYDLWLTSQHWPLSVNKNYYYNPDSKVYGANMGTIWGQQDPGGPHVGPVNLVIWDTTVEWLLLFREIYKYMTR